MKKVVILSVILLLIASCKRFDSDNFNKKMIQGEWSQIEVLSTISDSLNLELNGEETIILDFRGDSCFEKLRNHEAHRLFIYKIKNYYIYLEEQDTPVNYLRIDKLTKDSLILRTEDRILKYVREQ